MTQSEAVSILSNINYNTLFQMEYVYNGKSINGITLLLASVGLYDYSHEYCKFTERNNYCIIVNGYAVTQFEGTQTWNNIFDDLLKFVHSNTISQSKAL
jgi:hypothetical protein